MRAIKKFAGGGIADNRSVSIRTRDEKRKSLRIKELEEMIASVKGTPKAKPLVKEYRALTNT